MAVGSVASASSGVRSGLGLLLALLFVTANAYFLPKPLEARPSIPDEIAMPSMTHTSKVVGDEWKLEYYVNPKAVHPAFEPVLNVRFPNLSRRQFRKLRKVYRGCGSSKLTTYQRNCTVVDFLAPLVGKLVSTRSRMRSCSPLLPMLWIYARYHAVESRATKMETSTLASTMGVVLSSNPATHVPDFINT